MKTTACKIFLLLLLSACSPSERDENAAENAIVQDTLFDILRGELVKETEDSVWYEPYERKIPKVRKIFKKGRVYTYRAIYRSDNGDTLSDSNIKLIPSGERIEFAPERQDKIIIVFENYRADSVELAQHDLNPSLKDWWSETTEGIIENSERVWMHPIRVNQYKFTEVAPFPEVMFPLTAGDQWDTGLNIHDGWGEWSNTSGRSEYRVVGKDFFTLQDKQTDVWKIKSQAEFPFGKSHLDYKFSSNYGFVEFIYKNYKKETLQIKLIKTE